MLRYGIELEYERYNGAHLTGSYWRTVPDGSLRNSGIELVSQPVTSEELDLALAEASAMIRRGTMRASPRCGIHVHMNMKHLTAGQMFSFITAYTLLEPAIFAGFPERLTSSFCVPVYKSGFTVRHIHDAVQATRIRGAGRSLRSLENTSKYAALNTASLVRFGTLEFRQMPATTRMSAVRGWVDTLTRILNVATLQDDPVQIVELYEGLGDESFQQSFLMSHREVDPQEQRKAYIAAIQTAGYIEPEWDELDWVVPVT
jgi:hypothetical protein